MTLQQQKTLIEVCTAAVASECATGVPADLTAAQCILESGWMQYVPPGTNNPFGVKATTDSRKLCTTKEWFTPSELAQFLGMGDGRTAVNIGLTSGGRSCYAVKDYFEQYASLADAFADHARLISCTAPYYEAFQAFRATGDLPAFIYAVAKVYATAPGYGDSLMKLINEIRPTLEAARKANECPEQQ